MFPKAEKEALVPWCQFTDNKEASLSLLVLQPFPVTKEQSYHPNRIQKPFRTPFACTYPLLVWSGENTSYSIGRHDRTVCHIGRELVIKREGRWHQPPISLSSSDIKGERVGVWKIWSKSPFLYWERLKQSFKENRVNHTPQLPAFEISWGRNRHLVHEEACWFNMSLSFDGPINF